MLLSSTPPPGWAGEFSWFYMVNQRTMEFLFQVSVQSGSFTLKCHLSTNYWFLCVQREWSRGHWQNVVHWRREWQTTSVFLPWEPHEQYERQNDRILEEELLRSVGVQYATGDQWRNNSRKNEGMEPMQKEYPVVDVTGDRRKVRCCKEQYCKPTFSLSSL